MAGHEWQGDLSDGARLFPRRTQYVIYALRQHAVSAPEVLPGVTPAAQWLSFFQPDVVVAIGGLKTKVKSARLLKTGQNIPFTQDEPFSLQLKGLPVEAPDSPLSVIEVECEGDPIIDAWETGLTR